MSAVTGWLQEPQRHKKGLTMKIVVIGGSGLIGSKLVNKIRVPPALIRGA
jgi:hypothetical protein